MTTRIICIHYSPVSLSQRSWSTRKRLENKFYVCDKDHARVQLQQVEKLGRNCGVDTTQHTGDLCEGAKLNSSFYFSLFSSSVSLVSSYPFYSTKDKYFYIRYNCLITTSYIFSKKLKYLSRKEAHYDHKLHGFLEAYK